MGLNFKLYSLMGAMLYLGPLLAGLTGAPEFVVAVFVAIFTLWVVVMRPAIWTKIDEQGAPVALALHLGAITIMQALLVILSFALGRGIAVLMGATLDIPPVLSVALSGAALLIARLMRAPHQSDRLDFLDEAIQTLNDMNGDSAKR
jgi:hypothetical protein